MRRSCAVLILALAAGGTLLALTNNQAADSPVATVDAYGLALPRQLNFTTEIQPILSARCMPCHFEGGKMYHELPFDQPATIRTLGEKLFTRITDENEQRLIREFLAQL